MKPSSNKFAFLSVYTPSNISFIEAKVLGVCKDLKILVKSVTEEKLERDEQVAQFFSKKTKTVKRTYYQYVVELDNPTEQQWWMFHGACYGFAYGHFPNKGLSFS